MKAAFQVMQNLYENRKTGEKAIGITVMVSGDFEKMLDDIMKKDSSYGDYSEVVGAAIRLGIAELQKGNK